MENLVKLKAAYADADQPMTRACLDIGLAGFVYGAVNQFNAWSLFMHQFDLWRITEFPIPHMPFKWEWFGLAAKILGALPALIVLAREISAWKRGQGVLAPILVHVGIAVLSALFVTLITVGNDSLAFGLAGATSLAVAGETLKIRLSGSAAPAAVQPKGDSHA